VFDELRRMCKCVRSTACSREAKRLYMAVRSERTAWEVIGIRADNAPPSDAYRKNLMDNR